MKSLIKFAALSCLVAASVGIVACNNNSRSLKAAGAVPGAQDVVKPVTAVDPKVEETADPNIGEYTMALIDQQDSSKTFPIQGQLHKTAENAAYFNFLGQVPESSPTFAYVIRIAQNGGSGDVSRDYAFVFEEGENMRVSTGTLYVEHQDLDNYLMKIPFIEIPNFAVLADSYNSNKEILMQHFADFVDEQQPVIDAPGILYPEGHSLPENLVQLWQTEFQNDSGWNI